MTAQEVHRLLAVIRVAYPNWQKGQEIAASNLWEEALADIDYDAGNAAYIDKQICADDCGNQGTVHENTERKYADGAQQKRLSACA